MFNWPETRGFYGKNGRSVPLTEVLVRVSLGWKTCGLFKLENKFLLLNTTKYISKHYTDISKHYTEVNRVNIFKHSTYIQK